ncbi:MAG: carboxymuconolactone decarboxylase family protein [Candidatus Bathyarchaeia archaeon]
MWRHIEDFKKAFAALSRSNPGAADGLSGFMEAILAGGALDAKTKELIALATAVTNGCEPCITVHVQRSLAAGATRDEVFEAAGVAVLMGGVPALTRIVEVEKAVDEFAWRPSV